MADLKVSFWEMFSPCAPRADSPEAAVLRVWDEGVVVSAQVDKARAAMELTVEVSESPAPTAVGLMEERIAAAYNLDSVSIRTLLRRKKDAGGGKPAGRKPAGRLLWGKKLRGNVIPVSELTPESGRVVIEGEVFGRELREVRGGRKILSFNVTDFEGSLHVSRFLAEGDAGLERIEDGMYIAIQGDVSYDRWHGDIAMSPMAVERREKPVRMDAAPGEKRVELHMHSRYSQLDALTDITQMVATAARWGHKAVALTDHGVLQGYPELCNAGKKFGVKVIYGVEGYYVNDTDDRVAVCGEQDAAFTDEFVAFDLETTGLRADYDRITEIGAVILRNGKELARFQTFVNPGVPIPAEITRLTGIRDEDVAGAPGEREALEAFLAFAGGRVLAGHNIDFDLGFLTVAAERQGIPFLPTGVDTLILSQSLLSHLKKHSLDAAAGHLSLPEFRHHRASDDAATCGLLLHAFFGMLEQRGASRLSDIGPIVSRLRQGYDGKRQPKHILVLVKEQQGIRNLYELVSRAHLEHFKKNPIMPKSLLTQLRGGLLIGSACESGELFQAIVNRRSMRELRRIAAFYDFLEIQPLCNNAFLLRNGVAQSEEELRDYNRKVVQLGRELGKPVVATGDVHFLDPKDEMFRRILLSNKFSDCDEPLPLYFKTTDEMLREFAYLGKETAQAVVVDNPAAIADLCAEVAPLPTGLFTPKIENSASQLKELCYAKMHRLYGDHPPELVLKRVEEELGNICSRGYDVIYMSAVKLVAKSNEAGYLVGSRGSVGSSIIAYMSGITEVNALPAHYRCPKCRFVDFASGEGYACGVDMPDQPCPVCGGKLAKDGYNIPFETFLGFGGDKVPDIDLNFSGEYQSQAHRDTIELFGADHVFRAGTIGTIAEKTAYGYVKKYMEERGRQVSKVEENRLAAGFTGVKRTTGQHPGGLVVIPQDKSIYDFCPVQHPADDPDTDIITTHFEYHSMESNLLKLDMLGHDDPTMIHMLEELTGVKATELPLDDPDTMLLFRSARALGLTDDDPIIGKTGSIAVPEFGTKFTREMLVDTQPEKMSTLVRLSGFSHGTDVWLGNAKDIISSGTAGVDEAIGCRDDIMLTLIDEGLPAKRAFKIMESVRKGRGLAEDMEQDMRAAGVKDWYIDSCKKIKYLFPKAHAVAYVMMALRIAWFKVHLPLAFYCAYFTIRCPAFDLGIMSSGVDKVRQKLRELERRGNELKQAEKDLYTGLEVCYEFYLRGFSFAPVDLRRSHATRFTMDGDKLIPPFTAIAGLGESAAWDIYEKRDRDFISIEEFSLSCTKVSKTHIEQLRAAGAFGDMPESAQLSFF